MKYKNKFRFLPYSRQDINNKDIKKVIDVLKSDFITQDQIFLNLKKILQNMLEQNMRFHAHPVLRHFIYRV